MIFRKFRRNIIVSLMLIGIFTLILYYIALRSANYLVNKINRNREKHHQLHSNENIIVAQYVGTGNLFGNISKELVNENNYLPLYGAGEMGKPVIISERDSLKMKQLYSINQYNLLASDRISVNRTLPDYRIKECKEKHYPNDLPSTSIIIPFHNEAWSTLIRTVWSVINRSPHNLLVEILLVDDASDRVYLNSSLDKYVATLPIPCYVLRNPTREGLVAARLLGARKAKGEILTFLDAHCECSFGWLEPLLDRIKSKRNKVVVPICDIISPDNFGYTKVNLLYAGGFNWNLHFRWILNDVPNKQNFSEPFMTPAMAGGLFSVEKKYFFEVGAYDDQMKIWGAENVEMSLRIWQCGGEIETVPCSHVGHVFRQNAPYTFPNGISDTLDKNLLRTALVWMDEWAMFYTTINKKLKYDLDIEDRIQLRRRLQCKSFSWYLKNVWPTNYFPMENRFFGKIIVTGESSFLYTKYSNIIYNLPMPERNTESLIQFFNEHIKDFHSLQQYSSYCLAMPNNLSHTGQFGKVHVTWCDTNSADNLFVINEDGQIMANEGKCLDSLEKPTSIVQMYTCLETNRQKWIYDIETLDVKQQSTDYCLGGDNIQHLKTNSNTFLNYNLTINECKQFSDQKWIFLPFDWKNY